MRRAAISQSSTEDAVTDAIARLLCFEAAASLDVKKYFLVCTIKSCGLSVRLLSTVDEACHYDACVENYPTCGCQSVL